MSRSILFVHHGIGIGGAAINLRDIVERLSSDYEVYVLFLRRSSAIKLFDDIECKILVSRYPIYYFFHMSKWVKWYQFHKLAIQLMSFAFHRFFVSKYYLDLLKPDLVFLNSSVLLDWLISAKSHGYSTIINVQEKIASGYFGLRKGIIKRTIEKFSDRVLFISKDNMDVLAHDSNLKNKSTVIYNTVREDVELSNFRSFHDKRFDFIYLGGESEIKGWSLVRELLVSDLKFSILIVGEFSELTKSQYFENDCRVSVIGPTTTPLSCIADSKFLVSPFTEDHFSRPIIEAYFVGTVPIASAFPGVREQLENDVSGLTFYPKPSELIKVCRRALFMSESEYNSFIRSASKFRNKFDRGTNLSKAQYIVSSMILEE